MLANNGLRTLAWAELVRCYANVRTLDLSKNALTELGDELGQLVCLTRLNVASNALSRLPDALAACTLLRKLNASRNSLVALPDLAALPHLTQMNLAYNALTQLPLWLLDWPALSEKGRALTLHGNPLINPPLLVALRPAWLLVALQRERDLNKHSNLPHFRLEKSSVILERLKATDAALARSLMPLLNDDGPPLTCRLSFSAAQEQNWRVYQEDRFSCIPDLPLDAVLAATPPMFQVDLPDLWDDPEALYSKDLELHNALVAEMEREMAGEDLDAEKNKALKELERRKRERAKLQKDGKWEERTEEDSIEEQRRNICVEAWHRTRLERNYPLHMDSRLFREPALRQAERHAPAAAYFAVYDGHGGDHCADYVERNLHLNLCNERDLLERGAWGEALKAAYASTEVGFIKEARTRGFTSGSTACSVLLVDNTLTCANVGDSRAVLCRTGRALPLTRDHKPTLKDERARIEAAGGHVECSEKTGYVPRVLGVLAMSRSLGDLQLKEPIPAVSAEPEISTETLGPDDEFILLASDGLFDAMSNQEAVDAIRRVKNRHYVAQELAQTALRNSKDNVTVLVVWLHWGVTEPANLTPPPLAPPPANKPDVVGAESLVIGL